MSRETYNFVSVQQDDNGSSRLINGQISSYCSGGSCLMVAQNDDGSILVGDKQGDKLAAGFNISKEDLQAFIKGAANGEFNHLLK